MKRPLSRFIPARLVCAALLACVLLLSCGLTAFAAEEGSTDVPATEPPTAVTTSPTPEATVPLPPHPEEMTAELFPADVQTVIEDGARKIVKTYILTAGQNPAGIPRESFTRDGWRYTLTDITEKRISGTDTRSHVETVELNTETKDLNEIIKLLAPTLDYQSEDGYCGLLTLDLASVVCEAAGYKNSSYTVTAMREYPHLSTADTSLIPKTITENGRTLELESVSWEAQNYVNVDYQDIPDGYRAVATYTAKASKSVVTGYITTTEYSGEIAKIITGDSVYMAYFAGIEINPAPKPTQTPEPTETPAASPPNNNTLPLAPILIGILALAALGGAGAFFFLRRNVKIYRDGFRVLVAKDKINAKAPVIDLSPLEGNCFGVEIDKFAAKALNGHTIEIRHGSNSLKHKIAHEGNAYRIEADFGAGTVQAIY